MTAFRILMFVCSLFAVAHDFSRGRVVLTIIWVIAAVAWAVSAVSGAEGQEDQRE